MIRRLRRTHGVMQLLLVVSLPGLLVVAMRGPQIFGVQPASAAVDPRGMAEVAVPEGGLSLELHWVPALEGVPPKLSLRASASPGAPDVLVYWCAEAGAMGAPLPDGAQFLAALGSQPTLVSLDPPSRQGHLVCYSLGHRAIVDCMALDLDTGEAKR